MLLANCYTNISLTYRQLNEFDKALKFISNAETIRNEKLAKTDPLLAVTYISKSVILRDLNKIDNSIEYALKSMKVCREKGIPENHQLFGNIYYHIAKSYINTDIHSALKYALKSMKVREEINNKYHLDNAEIYLLLSQIYINQENKKEANSILNKAKLIYDENDNHKGLENISELEKSIKKML